MPTFLPDDFKVRPNESEPDEYELLLDGNPPGRIFRNEDGWKIDFGLLLPLKLSVLDDDDGPDVEHVKLMAAAHLSTDD